MSIDPLAAHATEVAPLLLGATVESSIHGLRVTVRLTEVEAYGGEGEDPGSHAFRGRTRRNAAMFGRPGLLYCYFTYGMHHCMNVVTGVDGQGAAVLLRAGEVVEGLEIARSRSPVALADHDLARGPGRLARILGVDLTVDGTDLRASGSPVRLRLPAAVASNVARSARTGVAGEGASIPWRFFLPDEPTVSRYRPAVVRRRSG